MKLIIIINLNYVMYYNYRNLQSSIILVNCIEYTKVEDTN